MPPPHGLTGDQTCNPGTCTDWNRTHDLFGLRDDREPTEPHGAGTSHCLCHFKPGSAPHHCGRQGPGGGRGAVLCLRLWDVGRHPWSLPTRHQARSPVLTTRKVPRPCRMPRGGAGHSRPLWSAAALGAVPVSTSFSADRQSTAPLLPAPCPPVNCLRQEGQRASLIDLQ